MFGHEEFNDGQFEIIANILSLKSTVGLLPTGSGKSVCYQLPCLMQPAISFVVSPLKSLMIDQDIELRETFFIERVGYISSSLNAGERERVLEDFKQKRFLFVMIAPERFRISAFKNALREMAAQFNIGYSVIDEVHCLSEWGHDFRYSYLYLAQTIKSILLPRDPVYIALTATASINVLKDICAELNIDRGKNVITLKNFTRPKLNFYVANSGNDKIPVLLSIVNNNENNQFIAQDINNVNKRKRVLFSINGEDSSCGVIFTP
ncbi:MAG: DEAD/DEAH box helicase [Clostridia bacterium]|nr:DEAD/DEAH box helicase [Clostridia bacterium]